MSEATREKTNLETCFEWQARAAIGAAKNLAHWVKMTEGERLAWEPKACEESQVRSVVAQINECIRVNRAMGRWLRGDFEKRESAEVTHPAEMERELLASAAELADAIRGLEPSVLERTFETPFGEMTGRQLMVIPVANMYYHGGQVNFIQCLYGDTQFHFPD